MVTQMTERQNSLARARTHAHTHTEAQVMRVSNMAGAAPYRRE